MLCVSFYTSVMTIKVPKSTNHVCLFFYKSCFFFNIKIFIVHNNIFVLFKLRCKKNKEYRMKCLLNLTAACTAEHSKMCRMWGGGVR